MATTLRSYNKRMRAFNTPPIKRSRRGLAEGGLAEGKMLPDVPEYSGTDYELGGAEISTEDQRRLASPMSRTYYQRGGVAIPPVAGPAEKGRTMTEEEKRSLREASAPQGSWPRMSGAQQTVSTKRLGLAVGGPVAVGRITYPEDESELMTEREREKLFPPELLAGIEPGADVSVGRVTFGGTPASLREADVAAAPASPEEALTPPGGVAGEGMSDRITRMANERAAVEGRTPVFPNTPSAIAPAARGTDMPVSTEPSEAEQAAGPRIAGLRRFGLDPFSTREKQVVGAPGVTKYRDASGRTLYANTLEDQGRVSTVPSTFKQDDARLTAAIKARLASGHPQDIEQARQLAVTPEQRALIGEAENMRGLRQRAARGDRGALLEMQGREVRAGAEAGRNLELMKILLGREPTPLQLAEFGLREKEAAARLGREGRQDALAQNQATIQNVFGSDEAGKQAQTRFHQRLATTLPQFQGDISRVPPAQLNALVQGSRLLDLIEQGKAPGAIARFFGGKQPRYDELMDAFNKAEIVPQRGFFNPFIKTPIGDISKGDVDEGTWRWLTHFVGNLHRSRQEAGLRGG
jgi:hypothetical protein